MNSLLKAAFRTTHRSKSVDVSRKKSGDGESSICSHSQQRSIDIDDHSISTTSYDPSIIDTKSKSGSKSRSRADQPRGSSYKSGKNSAVFQSGPFSFLKLGRKIKSSINFNNTRNDEQSTTDMNRSVGSSDSLEWSKASPRSPKTPVPEILIDSCDDPFSSQQYLQVNSNQDDNYTGNKSTGEIVSTRNFLAIFYWLYSLSTLLYL